jgi:hypothetical protein
MVSQTKSDQKEVVGDLGLDLQDILLNEELVPIEFRYPVMLFCYPTLVRVDFGLIAMIIYSRKV